MTTRIHNFSAGPAVLPVPVLEEARENLLSLGETGVGILEHSHRGKPFLAVYEEAVALIREVGNVPDEYDVLFLQGGASTQFCMVPMNFLTAAGTADYLVTGSWSQKAIKEARRFGSAHVVCSSEEQNFNNIPVQRDSSDNPAYVHYTSNNTIFGTQFREEPDVPDGRFSCATRAVISSAGRSIFRSTASSTQAPRKTSDRRESRWSSSAKTSSNEAQRICRRCCSTARMPTRTRCSTRHPPSAST